MTKLNSHPPWINMYWKYWQNSIKFNWRHFNGLWINFQPSQIWNKMFINKTIIKALCVNVSHYLQVTFSFPPHRGECGGPEWLTTSKLKANLRLYYHDHKKLISTEASPNVTCGRAGQQKSFFVFLSAPTKIALMYKRIGVYHTCGIFSSRRRLISDKVSFVPSKFQFINRFPEIFPTKTAPQHHLRSFPYRPPGPQHENI